MNERWLCRVMPALRQSPWTVPGLIGACVFLQSTGRSFEVPIAIMAIGGIWKTLRQPEAIVADPMIRAFAALFGCFWLPMVLALPDAVDFARGLGTTAGFLRFFFMAVFIRCVYRHEAHLSKLLALATVALTFWALDGMLQAMFGVNVFGYPLIDGQLTGMFYPRQTLGHVLAVFSPLFVLGLLQWSKGKPWLWCLLPVYGTMIVLSGKRGAWVMLLAALAASSLVAFFRIPPQRRGLAAVLTGIILMLVVGGLSQHEDLRTTWQETSGLLSRDFQQADAATSFRLTIWRTGCAIYQYHWLNGVGPRSFRNIYPDYALPGDFFIAMNPDTGPSHPHQITLEIGVETGAIGLLGFTLFWIWLGREFLHGVRRRLDVQCAFATAIAIAALPFNTSHALYGNFWSGILFWLLAMYLAIRYFQTPAMARS